MSLFLKLQKRVKELEQEKQILQDDLDKKEEQLNKAKSQVCGVLKYWSFTNLWLTQSHPENN